MGVWVSAAVGVLAFSVYESPGVYGLAWSAPWVMAVVLLGLEISRRAEHDLMAVSSILIIIFYFSCRALELFFYFEAAGLPLLLRIIIWPTTTKSRSGKVYAFLHCVRRFALAVCYFQ